MDYRRTQTPGGIFFFTLTTYRRQRLFDDKNNIYLLQNTIKKIKSAHPFKMNAYVLLPDHFHCIWTLPEGDKDFSLRWRLIKSYFTRECEEKYKKLSNFARKRKKEHCLWQRRFWEHEIRDARDYAQHINYIHYNPVKHGYVENVKNWQYSSFHHFVKLGLCEENWGSNEIIKFADIIGNE